ncbi:septum formation initiator family protein [uncultured Limosilactobacillus sp.]|uniref:FtsB family cell division protein n=1 Tax=uncultured Limosilactobacillus sp. TaxID=2837629 RepID=UPI0025FF6A4D|nr:septum formation initiator family protein [uncultured Limosilactobacillus sp.]
MSFSHDRVTAINTPYSRQQNAQMQANQHYIKKVHAKRRRVILLVTGCLTLLFGIQILVNHHTLSTVNLQIAGTKTELAAKKKTNRQLKAEVKSLHDPAYIQQVLRQKYNYSKSGETIYNFAN